MFSFFLILVSHLLFSADWFAVVADNVIDDITLINLTTNTPVQNLPTGSSPRKVAITPDATKALVTNFLSASVSIFDLTNSSTTVVPVGSGPLVIAITPNGQFAYVTDSISHTLTKIDIANATSTQVFDFGVNNNPRGIAITPDGASAYITFPITSTGTLQNTVVQFDLTSNTLVGAPIPVVDAFELAITPDGSKAYVTSFSTNTVIPIDLLTNTPGVPILVGINPFGIAISANGSLAIAVNQGDNSVTPINVSDNTTEPPIFDGTTPTVGAISPDSQRAYITDFSSDRITVINLSTLTVETTILLDPGSAPLGIAITPDQAPTAAFTIATAPADSPTKFDASSSFSPVGTIVSYAWDFGDGTTATVSTPTISHTYHTSSNFVVTLTVTNSAGTSTRQTFTGQTVSNNGGPSAMFSQQILTSIGLPSDIVATVKKNKFLNRTEYVLTVTWRAPANSNIVVAYRIYHNNALIAVIPANSALLFRTSVEDSCAKGFSIASVRANGEESARIPIVVRK